MKSFTIEVKEWKELKLEGNYKCPKCSSMLVVIPITSYPTWNTIFAFCVACKRAFEAEIEIKKGELDGT